MTKFLVNGEPVNTNAWSWIITSNSYVYFVKEGKKNENIWKLIPSGTMVLVWGWLEMIWMVSWPGGRKMTTDVRRNKNPNIIDFCHWYITLNLLILSFSETERGQNYHLCNFLIFSPALFRALSVARPDSLVRKVSDCHLSVSNFYFVCRLNCHRTGTA